MVAEENGWLECSAILRRWVADKDKDLRERETPLIIDERLDISASPPSCRSKRLHVKRSMDTAFAMLKPRETLVKTPDSSLLSSTPSFPPIDPNGRRPSLPQIIPPASADTYRKQSPGPRPRSAGTDSEQDENIHVVYGRGGAGRRQHGSKYSLMTIFKRAHAEEGLDATLASDGHGSPALVSASIPGHSAAPPPQVRSGHSSSSSTPNLPETPILALNTNLSHELADPSIRNGRLTPQTVQSQSPPTSLLNLPDIVSRPLAVDFQLALSEQSQFNDVNVRNIPSGPLIQPSFDDQDRSTVDPLVFSEVSDESERKVQPSPNSRPGILRAHNRMASNGQGSPLPRMLRFDSTSSVERRGKDSLRGIPVPNRSSDGSSSVPKSRSLATGDTTGSPAMGTMDLPVDDGKPIDTGEGDQDENYGQMLTSSTLKLNVTSMLLQRPRALSFGSPSDAELSPIDSVNDSSISALKSEFPFNMDENLSSQDDVDLLQAPRYLNVPAIPVPDKRGRGDSLSSNSTSSENRSNSHTSSSARGTISTPGLLSVLASPLLSDQPLDVKDFDLSTPPDDLSPPAITTTSSQSTTRSHRPTDVGVISTHADAEALVQQTRQDVLEFADNQGISPISISSGRSPLSARLAAYGQSLAIEKKLREKKEASESRFPVLEATTTELPIFLPSPLTSPQRSRDVMERQHSLRERRTTPRHRRPPNDPRRPSTAEGGVYHDYIRRIVTDRWDSTVTSTKQAIFVRESSRSASGQTQTLADVKRDLLFESPSLDREKSPSPESVRPPLGSQYLQGNYYHREESSGRSVDGADTTESDTIEQIIAIPVSDPKKSAVKLTRMGYPAEAANINRSTPPPLSTTRFGAFKTFVQTLRSKT